MLEPPSRKMASILFSVINRRAFSIRAFRSSSVIAGTAGVIGLSAAMAAGCWVSVAGCRLPADGWDSAGAGAHALRPAPNPAAALD